MKRLAPALLFALWFALMGLAPARAQVNPSRWGSTLDFGFGYVDRSMLANHFEIPIYTRATVGNAQIHLALAYNSNFWLYGSPGSFGWALVKTFGSLSSSEDVYDQYCGWWNNNLGAYDEWYSLVEDSFTFTEPDGTVPSGAVASSEYLELGGGTRQSGDEDDCSGVAGSGSILIPDGKGYTIEVYNLDQPGAYAHVFDSRGDEVDGLLEDPNGNEVTTTTSGGSTYFHDPLGNDPNHNPALTESGSGTESSPVVFTYTGPNGSQASITEQFAAQSVTSTGCGAYSGSPELPTELDLPDGRRYTFAYDNTGRVDAVTLPTGATIHYSYTVDCTGGGAGNSLLTRWDSVNGNAEEWSWVRSQQGGGAVQTTETSPDQNDGVFSFAAPYWVGEGGALTEADFYQGTGGSRTKLESIAYSNTLTNNYVTGQGLTYELYQNGQPALWRQVIFSYNDFGQALYQYDYDWGACLSCGALLRNATTSYTTLLGGAMNLPAQTTVSPYTGSGGQIAQTNYNYDSATGNLLSVQEYVNSTAYLTKSFAYNPNGTIATATDTNSGVTAYTYGNSGAGGCTDASGNGIFPTKIQGPVAAAGFATAVWNCTGGVEVSSTDANGLETQIAYDTGADEWRPLQLTAPDGSVTSISYISANQVERAMTFNSGASTSDTLTTLDGLGRPILAQQRQGPGSANFDTVQAGYDAMDRVVSVSMPFTQTAGVGGGTVFTTTSYDALSRPLLVTDGGGGTVGYSYADNDVLTTVGPAPAGENTKRKQEEFDGLGRLRSVCEINTLGGDGACGQAVAQSGYLTVYARNALGQITQVTQNAQTTPTQTRTFSFDQLGRLTAETNPESGTTAYTFDSDATCGISEGDLVKRVDANGNTTCYAYDALHRVTQISYPSGPNASATPTKTFVYDAATVDGTAMAKVVGKLAEAYTGSRATDLGFSYPNPVADEEDVYQSSPNSGGWTVATAQHFANGAVSTLTMPGAVPAITYSLDGEGRPAGAKAGVATLAGGATFSALGLTKVTFGSGDSDSYGYDSSTGRMTQYGFSVNGQTDTGALTWNAKGSLGTLAITDSIVGTGDTQTCNYAHDDLGRIASAACMGGDNWSQTFSYDSLGLVGAGPSAPTARVPLVLTPTRGPRGPKSALRFAGAAPLRNVAAYRADCASRKSGATPAKSFEERNAIVPAQLWDQQPHFDQHRLRAELRQRRRLAGRPGEHAAKRERLRRRGARGDAGGDRGDV